MATAERNAPRWTDYMRVADMQEADVNPKGHDEARIRGSISRYGFLEQPVLDERTGKLVAGHGRLAQLRALHAEGETPPDGVVVDDAGEWRWPVTRGWASRSDTEAEAVGVTLNRLTELGGWDDLEQLSGILGRAAELDPVLLDLAGYSTAELAALQELTAQPVHVPGSDADDDALLAETDRGAWPRISVQVPPDVFDRWRQVPGDDDGDRVMVLLRLWEQDNPYQPGAEPADDEG